MKKIPEREERKKTKKEGRKPLQNKENMKKTTKRLSIKKGKSPKSISNSEHVNLIRESMKTPVFNLQFCCIYRPYFFPGSHVPRYKITGRFDPTKKDHKKYLEELEEIAKENDVGVIGKMTDDDLIQISLQGRFKPQIFVKEKGKKNRTMVELEHDMPAGFECYVTFDLKKYFCRFNKKHAFTYTPLEVTFILDEESQEILEVTNGDSEDHRD